MELDCLPLLVYGGNLEPANETKSEVEEWIEDILESVKLFSNQTTLEDIYKYTRIYPSFITSQGLLEPICKGVTLKDAVLASLCNIGVYDTHTFGGKVYTHVSTHNPYPLYLKDKIENSLETLYIANYSKINGTSETILDGVENKLIQEYFDRVLNIVKNNDKRIILINGIFSKHKSDEYDVQQRNKNGKKHAKMFMENASTLGYMEDLLSNIRSQS